MAVASGGKKSKPSEVYDPRDTEAQQIYSWRFKTFRKDLIDSGVDPAQASAFAKDLADSNADRVKVEMAIAQGCDPDTLVAIFAP